MCHTKQQQFPSSSNSLESTIHAFLEAQSKTNQKHDALLNQLAEENKEMKSHISKLTNALIVNEKGKFPSQPQIPQGQHMAQGSQNKKNVEHVNEVTTRSGKNVDSPHIEEQEKSSDNVDLPTTSEPLTRPISVPFPQALKASRKLDSSPKILENLRQVRINLPLLHVIKQVPSYAKILKDLCTMKRKHNVKKIAFLTEQIERDTNGMLQCHPYPNEYIDTSKPCPHCAFFMGLQRIEGGSQFRDLSNHELLSLVNVQGQDPPQPPPSDPNREAPPTNLLLELIQNLQQNQSELAEAIKQLKEKDAGTKTLLQNEGGNQEKPHQDSGSHEKETTFVTMTDVANLLKQEREKNPKEPRLFVKKPPYPTELLKQPYPKKYVVPTFSCFDGRKGSALVHISKFIDSIGAYAGNGDLCLREFSKSLDDRAYTWYTTMPPGSVVWEDMVELFCGKYFQAKEKITLVNLHTTKQANGEDLLRYIHRFRDISLDCYANYEEGKLVGVCIDNMLPEFRAHLENLDISRFAQLLQKARKTALSVKPHTEKPKERKSQPQVLMVSTANNKCKKSNERSFKEPPPSVPCTLEEMMAILNKWVADGIVKLPEISKKIIEEDKKNPKFCYFHQYVHHSTADCWTLRRKFHEKIQDGTLELPQARQKVHIDPFLKHKEKGAVSVVIHGSASDADMDEPVAANSAMTPAAIKTLQRNPRFRSLFNQLGLNPEARTAATEAIMAITADSGAHCFTAETHANRAFLETTNAITFTDEDMEVQYPDHRRPLYLSATINEVQVRRTLVDTGSCINLIPLSTIQAVEISQKKIQGAPMEIKGFGGIGEYTKGHIQLVLKVGPIVALTRFHIVDSVVPYHKLLGRPWLHKH
uniref:Retrotransposon gag domain-containing protein n=1 Tax=Fagus sylvatica TaxID=28930 RepID=A0A2N9G5E9_FAGSY